MEFDSVFMREPRRGRSQPALTQERIVAETIALLDEKGAAALTMRGLAARLGVHATSLYWYVDRREDLIDLALDEIVRPVAAAAPPAGAWDAVVTADVTAMYTALTAHPWAPAFFGTRPLIGPNALAMTARLQAVLTSAGAPPITVATIAAAVSHLAIGAATTAAGFAALNLGDDDASQRIAAHLGASSADAVAWRPEFADQLEMLLDGVRARLA
ncbi:TetR/AcrR family transcriptional regulator [Catenuloplanes sp. NPDC051500]|uniref:TetR/AcrR family transcriptional regulator n=1 Tax=Catenuloplanes sp. NPDC051500 TaxID=3363959 RepID=UPI0037BD7BEA